VPAAQLVYLDSSAFVKLVIAEAETPALLAALAGVVRLVASEILEVEALRAIRRADGALDAAHAQLAGVRLLPLSEDVRTRAAALEPPSLRSLDAIHLATALSLGGRLEGVYTYDARMSVAARDAGLDVHAPA
jgi:predicted nucleic acid-binding protein